MGADRQIHFLLRSFSQPVRFLTLRGTDSVWGYPTRLTLLPQHLGQIHQVAQIQSTTRLL